MTEQDGFRVEAAMQFGFQVTDDDGERFACTEEQLIAFAKACERAGKAQAANKIEDVRRSNPSALVKGVLQILLIDALKREIAAIDLELAPILGAEHRKARDAELKRLVADANTLFDALTPEQQAEHLRQQAASWAWQDKD